MNSSLTNDLTHPQRNWLEAADKIGIPVPDDYRAAIVKSETGQRTKEIKSLEAKLAALRGV